MEKPVPQRGTQGAREAPGASGKAKAKQLLVGLEERRGSVGQATVEPQATPGTGGRRPTHTGLSTHMLKKWAAIVHPTLPVSCSVASCQWHCGRHHHI